MSVPPLQSLQAALVAQQGSGPFALDSAFLGPPSGTGGVAVPASYDADVAAAFGAGAASSFKVTLPGGSVGAVSDAGFTVTGATVPFFGKSFPADMMFGVDATVSPNELVVQVRVRPQTWTWTDSFEFASGWPFSLLDLNGATFVFSTVDGPYPWTDTKAAKVEGGPKQNLAATLPLPDAVTAVGSLFDQSSWPTSLTLRGALDCSAYNGTTVLLPKGALTAVLYSGSVELLGYLKAADPSLVLTLPPPPPPPEQDAQSPMLSVSVGLGVAGNSPSGSPYALFVDLLPAPSSPTALALAGSGATGYQVRLVSTGAAGLLSPAAIVDLVGGGDSFFSGVPAPVQQFLTEVGLLGVVFAGELDPFSLDSVSVLIGTAPDMPPWVPIPEVSDLIGFSIEGFALQWTISKPFGGALRRQSFVFRTQFTLAPSVFKGPGGVGDGVFEVEFTSDLQLYASFTGTAKLSDFVSTLTGLALPDGIDTELSDVALALDYSAKSFRLSSGYSVSLAFLTIGDKPVLSITNGEVTVSAVTPSNAPGGKPTGAVWSAEVSGLVAIGPLATNASVSYDGGGDQAGWKLHAALAQQIDVQQVIEQFFDPGGTYTFPDFLPGDLKIKAFSIDALLPAKGASSYTVMTTFSWMFDLSGQSFGIETASIVVKYDGSKVSGSAEGTTKLPALGLKLKMGYTFTPSTQGANQTLYVEWEGFRATYSSNDNTIAFTMKGWTLGSLIQALVKTLGDPYFTLPAPWDLLNKVSLDGLEIDVGLKPVSVSAKYTLSSPLDLGFLTINKLVLGREKGDDKGKGGKVTLAIEGSVPDVLKPAFGSLLDPAKGQDVQKMPDVPGRGSSYFKVELLVLGQRVGITGHSSFANVADAIAALSSVPSTTGDKSPVNPTADPSAPAGQPYYEQSAGWLVAGHLKLLQVEGTWTVDVMAVFADPDLYGLRLQLAGPKAGGLAGLCIDILYKKITDDIGLYQVQFTFPDSIRKLNFGAVAVTLPQIGVQVYTNGDFLIDIGFPYKMDFSRSFSFSAIVYGVPVLGSGGFYFGKLSSATATQVPVTQKGTFDPVIVFGVGLQIGLGYDFTRGPLSAGFAITFFGIVEGVIAPWHPYPNKALPEATGTMQDGYYFKLSGTIGIIGLLYGKIDFAIIQATLNVKVVLSLQITYESYRAIPLVASASVDVSLEVKIDLGLFSISISLSFSTTVTATYALGSDSTAPWDDDGRAERLAARPTVMLGTSPALVRARAREIRPAPKRIIPAVDRAQVTAVLSPKATVLAPEGATDPSLQEGAFVLLLAMDAPDPTSGAAAGDTSFDRLCAAYFPWLVDALAVAEGDTVDPVNAAATVVTHEELESFVARLADLDDPALSIGDLLGFMHDAVDLDLRTAPNATAEMQAALSASATLFPVFDGLSLTVPDVAGTGTKPIDFETYTTATPAYRKAVASLFEQVEATIAHSGAPPGGVPAEPAPVDDDPESMAALVFVDAFSIVGRQLLQSALDALASYAYPLGAQDSISTIITWAGTGNALHPDDVALPNQNHALSPSIQLAIGGLTSAIQASDTLTTIAQRYSDSAGSPRWTTTPAELITANLTARVLAEGVTVTFAGSSGPLPPYVTKPGDSFGAIGDALGIDIAQQTALYDLAGLLVPAQTISVPAIKYTTAPAPGPDDPSPDTLATVAQAFATTVSALAADNTTVGPLFSPKAEGGLLTLANLKELSVGDLWTSVAATGQVAHVAGMVARFLMFGLRLPSAGGLTQSSEFLYPAGQQGYGLYQLTGQQFPAPGATDPYSFTIARAAQSHDVDLGFVTFDGAAVPSADVQVDHQTVTDLADLVTWAKAGNFQPAPTFEALPGSIETPKAFAAQSFSRWTTSALDALAALTDRGTGAGTPAAQPQPTLWMLPPALTDAVSTREQTIEAAVGGLAKTIPLLPQAVPQVGTTSPASKQTSYSDLTGWAWTTRVDFGVKRLPATGGSDASEPAGPASAPSLPNVYEIVAASSAQTLLLEQLLVAMDALGEDVVSSAFLMYEQGGALTTLGASEFLAFVTQTNLSTETNPERSLMLARAMAGAAPTGIGNSPGELVRLLWELSVVRSGGYYLYYRVASSGEGLPAPVFDTSGTGTVSLVVTYAATGSKSFGTAVPSFVNSFVTTDALDERDVVRLESVEGTGTSAALTGAASETLAAVAATYGATPGRLASANSTTVLHAGSTIPFAGLTYQLTPADVEAPGDALDAVAGHYSVGAASPLTGAQIASFNPGVPVAEGSIFFIPTFDYVVPGAVVPSPGPGTSFGSMAAYYGIPVEAVAVAALDVGSLFDVGTVLQVDTQMFDVQANFGPGNVAFELEMPSAVSAAVGSDPATSMAGLYRTLSAGLRANAFFGASPMGLPFGPQAPDDPAAMPDAFAGHASRARHRTARLAAVAAADDRYVQTLGFGSFASLNAAPDSPGLPAKAANPYVGVGAAASVALRWQDIFGNTTVTPFEAPPAGYRGAIDGAAAPVAYGDLLVGLAAWPGVRASYVYEGTAGAPVLTIDFAFDGTMFAGDPDEAKRALAVFELVYFQLHQDYTGLGLPGVTGNAVSMAVTSSLLATQERALSDTEAAIVRAFAAACVQYLESAAGPSALIATPPTATLSLPMTAPLVDGNVVELGVQLVMRRQPQLVDPKVAALAGGLETASPVLAKSDDTGGAVSYQTFATSFEAVFARDEWSMKVAEGLPNDLDPNGGHDLWAVRFGKTPGQAIYFDVTGSPSYYAPKPIATALVNDTATIVDYADPTKSTEISFRGVDQNLWFEAVLGAIDAFLSAESSAAAFVLDKCLGTHDPQTDGYLGKVLDAKQSLADSIGKSVEPILSTSAADDSTAWAAAGAMRQQLLNRLAAAYTAGAVIVYGLDDVSGGGTAGAAGPPNLYAHPGASIAGASENQNFTVSTGRIPLGPLTDDGKTYDPRLAFTFVSKNVQGDSTNAQGGAYVPLELDVKISHIEVDRTLVPGIEGYVQSRWLAFVCGPVPCPIPSDALDVPVVNRALPAPPTVQSQSGTRPFATPRTVTDLTKWDYGFGYTYGLAPGDSVNVEIRLNPSDSTQSQQVIPEYKALFDALAQFVSSYAAIEDDLATYLPKIARGEVDAATLAAAKKAVSAFEQYVTTVAAAYAASLNPTLTDDLLEGLKQAVVTFEVVLDSDESGNARTDVASLEIDGVAATWDPTAGTMTNGTLVLPAPVIAIAPALYTPEPVAPPPNVEISYRYSLTSTPHGVAPVYLSYEDAEKDSARTVSINGLDVMAYQGGTSAVWVVRNRLLFPVGDIGEISTRDTFLFQTPVVRFADKITPRLEYASFPLGSSWPGGAAALQEVLDSFFQSLFTGGDGSTSVKVQMTAAYSYEPVEGSTLFPRVVLPIAMLPPALASVDPATAPSFTGPLASAVDDWRRTNDPTLDGAPAVDFTLQVFGTSGAQQPLLVVDDLGVAVEPPS
ncbi:MAG TPA: peptidoglycan-binding protein [Actinomycetota bacterium]|nr:peptidoglycan-binding protein [Actinomycetota bacterium]